MEIRIPEQKVSEIRAAANILDVVSDHVILKRAGKNWIGLCPFHSEKTPSFTVTPERQIFYCFGCGVGGNVISFLMKVEGISFLEALKSLAKRYRIEIPEKKLTPAQIKKISERERFFEINSLASSFFRENLASATPEAAIARQYLEKRGIDPSLAASFGIGYASESWDSLLKFLSGRNVSPDVAGQIGLAVKGKNGSFYDRFRNRIVFPIHDVSGRVTGFGGRVLDDSKPKYLNSPETALYHKGRSIYALNLAREKCRQEGVVYISEGYIDIVSLHQFGVTNSVATLGTALTVDQIRILKGYASQMVLVYDSDEAGRSAAVRSSEAFFKEGVDAYVLLLPDGEDPDSFVRRVGADGFNREAESKRTILDFVIDEGIRKNGVSVAGKVKIIDSVCSLLSHVGDKIERSLHARQAAQRLGVDPGAFLEKAEKKISFAPSMKAASAGLKKPETDTARMEKMIVSMMLQFPDDQIMRTIAAENVVSFLRDETLKLLATVTLEVYMKKSGAFLISDVIDKVDEQHKRYIAEIGLSDFEWTVKGCLGVINQFLLLNRQHEKELIDRIKEAEKTKDLPADLKSLLQKKQELSVRNHRK